MAHYAVLDENNVVEMVITGVDEGISQNGITDWETFYSAKFGKRCLRTSYNTVANQHREGGTPFRGNFAGIGFSYDETLDAFLPPQPFPSWTLDTTTVSWVPPVSPPETEIPHEWDEDSQSWVEV